VGYLYTVKLIYQGTHRYVRYPSSGKTDKPPWFLPPIWLESSSVGLDFVNMASIHDNLMTTYSRKQRRITGLQGFGWTWTPEVPVADCSGPALTSVEFWRYVQDNNSRKALTEMRSVMYGKDQDDQR
jgi:hypothetical protein